MGSRAQSTFLAALGAALLAVVVSLLALQSDEGEALATVTFAICSVATTICFAPLLLSLSVAMGVFALRNNFMGLEISQAYVRYD